MIDPAGIPQFHGSWEELAKDVSSLRDDAIGIRNGGADIHSRFQMLGAYYTAPEAEDLFATTQPVMDEADTFATRLETVADALDTFAAEARPLAEKLESLRSSAEKFAASVEGDDDWTDDGDKTARNNGLWADVNATRSAFQDAENRAATKISALVGGPRFIKDDGSHTSTEQTVMYGYDTDLLNQAKDLPWGNPVSQTTPSDDYLAHFKHFVIDGFVVDGAGATVQGLGTLVGIGGSAKEAWSNLGDVIAGGFRYAMTPVDWIKDQTLFADVDNETATRQKAAFRAFGKAMVAWDEWEEHPVQAAGTTTFNALTLAAGPLGWIAKGGSAAAKAGLGAKAAGAGAKAAGIGAKIGTYADPLSAALTVGSKGISKLPTIAELTSRVSPRLATTTELQRVHSTLEVDGHRVLVKDGQFIRLDAEGRPIQDTARSERAPADSEVSEAIPRHHEPALSSAGIHASASSHAGGIPTHASHGTTIDSSSPQQPSSGSSHHADAGSLEEHGASGHNAASTTSSAHGSGIPGSHGGDGSIPQGPLATHGEPPMDPEVVDARIKELDDRQGGEGHAPGRHLYPNDAVLQARLGTPILDPDGNPKLYGQNSSNAGHVKSKDNIDPLTGDTIDGVHGGPHKVGPYATRFNSAEDMVRADAYFREKIAHTNQPPDPVAIEDILGPGAHERFSGFYRDPANLDEFLPVNFEGGTIKPVYRLIDGDWKLVTLYANPAPGRHP
ncbi:hypothetical protein [Streptomyces flavofungini]|uniref:hypothetical protein n=1 Tax=Streptomyces flavofungini TaxID=68200 RepID=UPI0034DF761E